MSLYGEIVEPVSRTAWEDWDEINPNNVFSELKWSEDIDVPTKIETVFLFEGKFMSDCVSTQSRFKLDLINSVKEINLNLYKVSDSNIYVCVIKDYNLVQSSEIVNLLKQYLMVSKDVIAIQTKPLAEYNTVVPTESCVIRTVTTSKEISSFQDFNYSKLEQPNIISGISAGAISLREHINQPGIAIICYVEHAEVYEEEKMQHLLKKLNIEHNVNSGPGNILSSNLYL